MLRYIVVLKPAYDLDFGFRVTHWTLYVFKTKNSCIPGSLNILYIKVSPVLNTSEKSKPKENHNIIFISQAKVIYYELELN